MRICVEELLWVSNSVKRGTEDCVQVSAPVWNYRESCVLVSELREIKSTLYLWLRLCFLIYYGSLLIIFILLFHVRLGWIIDSSTVSITFYISNRFPLRVQVFHSIMSIAQGCILGSIRV
jgi:hypothetical protein